jgi:hypothetical protein
MFPASPHSMARAVAAAASSMWMNADIARQSPVGGVGGDPFPDHTPSGRPIAKGPVVGTVRECLAVVESGEAVVIFGARAEHYYSNPGIRYIEIDVPPVGTSLVRRRADRRRVILDLEECSRDIAAGLLDIGGTDPNSGHYSAR